MRSTTTLAALCAVTALALTACGSDKDSGNGGDRAKDKASAAAKKTKAPAGIADLTGPQITNRAIKATKAASSLTVDLDGTVDGGAMKYHMTSDSKGECVGTISMGGEGSVRLIKTGSTAYMKYDAAFWKAQGKDGEAAAEMIGDRWTKADASGADAKDLIGACDSDQLLSGFEAGPNLSRKGKLTTVDGQPAITVVDKAGDETTTLYVATEGKPYILKLVATGGEEPGTIRFSDFDKPVDAKAPTGDVLDLDSLGG